VGLLVFLTGCPSTANKAPEILKTGKVNFDCFDTVSYVYNFHYEDELDEKFTERCEGVFNILTEYHRMFDIYYEYSGMNNLCTVNKNAGGEAIEVDERLIDFLLYAKELYTLTDGEMNVMMGAVLRPWHDCRTAASNNPSKATIPEMDELIEANRHTDISLLEIDAEKNTVRITDPKARIDVGALGKGYATEKAAQYLENDGATSYVLNIGGNIRIIGQRVDGNGWKTGVTDPHKSGYATYLNISDISCVTSGDYERFYTVNGVRYHHIIDKDTLMPSNYFSSVTVLTKDSGLADALSTALFSMSYEDGLKLLEKVDARVEVFWVATDGTQYKTKGLDDYAYKG
jgi:thiamine biosynthesis lipoprotein